MVSRITDYPTVDNCTIAAGNPSLTDRGDHLELRASSNENVTIRVGNNGRLENVNLDRTASGASILVVTYTSRGDPNSQASNWVIRNVAWSGTEPSSGRRSIGMGCSSGSTGLIENVYLGDGESAYPVSSAYSNYPGAMLSSTGHAGHITFRGVYARGWIDNAFYCSPRSGGRFTFENCLAEESQISSFRVARGDRLENCYGSYDRPSGRGLWIWGYGSGDIVAEDCGFRQDHPDNNAIHWHDNSTGSGDTIELRNSSWNSVEYPARVIDGGGNDNNPQRFVPEGCPLTAEEAYLGEPGDGTPPEPEPTFDDPVCVRDLV